MKRVHFHRYAICLAVPAAIFAGAVLADPPSWAPAHGYRAKQQHQYTYYPSQGVYYSPENRVWFWAGGNGWQVGASLPIEYQSGLNLSASVGSPQGGVSVTLDTDKPYLQNDYVVQQYGGPGNHGHGKGQGHGHGKHGGG